MKLINILENNNEIGIVVQHPDEPDLTDFWVFVWPNPDNTIADQSRKLEKYVDNNHVNFYKKLQKLQKPQKIDNELVYGPFDNIEDLL